MPAEDAIGREIRQLREDLGGRLTDIKSELARLVPREVYDAHRGELMRRVEILERDVEMAERQREEDAKAAALERKTAKETAFDQKIQFRRWLISAVSIPVLLTLAMMVFNWLQP